LVDCSYANWQQILVAVAGLCDSFDERSSAISGCDRTQFKSRTFTLLGLGRSESVKFLICQSSWRRRGVSDEIIASAVAEVREQIEATS
jgi:hypothetical protein